MFIWRLNIGYWKINFIKRELGSLPQCFLSLLFSFPCLFCSYAVANFTYLTLVSLAWNHAKAHTHLSFPHSISPRRAFSMFTLSFPRTLHLNPPRGSSPWVVFSFPSKNREEDRNPGARRDVMANPREEWAKGYNSFTFPSWLPSHREITMEGSQTTYTTKTQGQSFYT